MPSDFLTHRIIQLLRIMPLLFCSDLFIAQNSVADTWNGSIRTKIQTDNRYDKSGDYTGEVWTQLNYDNPDYQLNGKLSMLGRASTDIYREDLKVYQAYLEKKLPDWALTVRGGRFEKSDSLGLYLLEGLSARYQFNNQPLNIEVYAGRPVRIDHVRSVNGRFVAGAEGLLKLTPLWGLPAYQIQINELDLRMGLQTVMRDQSHTQMSVPQQQPITGNQYDADESGKAATQDTVTTYRWHGAARMAGHLWRYDKPAELFLQTAYRFDKNQLEDVLLEGWWDALKDVRFRQYFEAYRPKQPFVTFRDRFYSAYALGEQTVWRGSAEHKYDDKLRYSVGFQYANRDGGYSGFGFNAGANYQWQPSVTLRGELDYLELSSGENAKSLYLSGSHALNAKTRYAVNLAFRAENKSLYGENLAAGLEHEWQYMLSSSMILAFKGSYIHNTAINDEYLAALQFTYYFDPFKPRKP